MNGSASTATGRWWTGRRGFPGAVSGVLESRGMGMTRTEILGLFANVEPRVQGSENFLKYRDVLRTVLEFMGSELGARFGGA